jgi:uncharacterized damage-inducible protein DinB
MTLTELFLEEINREGDRSKRALEQVPEGKADWKPHETALSLGYLSQMVAMIPSWVAMAIEKEEFDIAPPDGPKHIPPPMTTAAELTAGLSKALADARAALGRTTDAHLETKWKLLTGGKVALEQPRRIVIRDAINHAAHHRGQMTVYLRMLGAKVPAIYGPSADDKTFA